MAKLPFRVDPEKYLTSNKNQASKMLERICKKYFQDKEVTKMIEAAFEKLLSQGHLVFWEDVSEQEKMILKRAAVSYYIPWDISFSGSISTPARPTFNASKNSPNGTILNDVLVQGVPNLVKLLHMILGWVCGPEAYEIATFVAITTFVVRGFHTPHKFMTVVLRYLPRNRT